MSTIIKHKEFTNHKVYKTEVAGRPLTIDVGKVAELATASAMVTYGETTVLVAVTVSPRPRDGVDFFPLSVDFEEKLYAVGRIPGSFMRREGQPSLPAVLASRVIDRSIRPLFPYDFRNDVVVTATVMSVDRDCSPEVTAMIGVSACLAYSCIPWAGPIGCLEVGYVDGQIVLNPTNEQKHASQLDLTVAATDKKVIMIEAGAKELPDDIMYDAIVAAHEDIKKQVAFINQIVAEIGRDKMTYDHADFDQELFDKIVEATMDEARAAMDTDDKNVREERWNKLIEHWHELFLEDYPEMDKYLEEITYKFQKKIVKAWLLEGHRVDGRAKNEIRPLAAEVGVLPRVHGSGLFTRGQTQVLSVCTLNTLSAAQKLDTIWAGTKAGITAIQMDIKNDGLSHEIIKEALEITRDARYAILDEIMLPCISKPRPDVADTAPKMVKMKIDVDKIREVIGSGGKVIQKICADTGAKIDIEDDGTIYIAGTDKASCDAAKKTIETIVFVPEVGQLYYGKVVRILQFGAFVELAPGKDGMVHISKLADRRVEKVEDVVNIGDMIWVKVTDIDEKGRVNLSYKDALKEIKAKKEAGEPIK